MAEHVHVAVHVQGTPRTETLMGREYRVVPATLVRSQVLMNNLGATFLPAADITADWADAANGAPVVIEHPTNRGVPVSARSPDVLNSRGAGFLFRTRAENGELKGDVFLDASRADAIEGVKAVLEKLDAGEVVELSTGFPVTVENVSGTFNGEAYDRVIHPIGFDHLALLPNAIGACSVTDGCGLGVNHRGPCEPKGDAMTTNTEVAPAKSWLRRMLDRFADSLDLFPDATNESDEDRRKLLWSALRERFGGEDVRIWIEAVFSDDGFVVYEREADGDAGLFRIGFQIDDNGVVAFTTDPVEVRRVTTFEPVANQAGDPPNGGNTMNREQMIAHLAKGGRDAEALAKLSDCDLKALMGTNAEPKPEPAANADEPKAQPDGSNDATNALRAELDELKAKLATLESATKPAVEERERERELLLEEIAQNERIKASGFTEDELKAMTVENLRKVRALVRGESYAGRGGPKAGAQNAEPAFMEPVPYWAENGKES